MKVYGSVYEAYEKCPTCGQDTGEPCLSLTRKYKTVIRCVHPNRLRSGGRLIRRKYYDPTTSLKTFDQHD